MRKEIYWLRAGGAWNELDPEIVENVALGAIIEMTAVEVLNAATYTESG